MDSRNHIYSASISTFLYKVLGGIRPTAPGFAQALIAPYVPAKTNTTPPLRSVEASVGTPFGRIVSSWTTDVDPVGPLPPAPPLPDVCGSKTIVQCDIQEEGDCATCAHVCVGCKNGGAKIDAIVYAELAPRRQMCVQACRTAALACTSRFAVLVAQRPRNVTHAPTVPSVHHRATGQMPLRSWRACASAKATAAYLSTFRFLATHAMGKRCLLCKCSAAPHRRCQHRRHSMRQLLCTGTASPCRQAVSQMSTCRCSDTALVIL